MKIIGHTQGGYIVECSTNEMSAVVGRDAYIHYDLRKHAFPVGTEIPVGEKVGLINNLQCDEAMRFKIAAQLRASATLLESVVPVFSLPEEASSESEQASS